MRRLINYVASRIKGQPYQLDSNITVTETINRSAQRLAMLARGVTSFHTGSKFIFRGRQVKLYCTRLLRLDRGVTLGDFVTIDALSVNGVQIGRDTSIGPYTIIKATGVISNLGKGVSVGARCGIGAFSHLGGGGGVAIGNDVIMGQYISFHPESHLYADTKQLIRKQGVSRQGITIGSNCWVGAKATFLDGTAIGDNCVVAAGAVVRGTFPSNCVIGGVPAKILKIRE